MHLDEVVIHEVQRDRVHVVLNLLAETIGQTGAAVPIPVVVSNPDAYEQFVRIRIHPIGGIASIDNSFVYGTVRKTAVFPRPG